MDFENFIILFFLERLATTYLAIVMATALIIGLICYMAYIRKRRLGLILASTLAFTVVASILFCFMLYRSLVHLDVPTTISTICGSSLVAASAAKLLRHNRGSKPKKTDKSKEVDEE